MEPSGKAPGSRRGSPGQSGRRGAGRPWGCGGGELSLLGGQEGASGTHPHSRRPATTLPRGSCWLHFMEDSTPLGQGPRLPSLLTPGAPGVGRAAKSLICTPSFLPHGNTSKWAPHSPRCTDGETEAWSREKMSSLQHDLPWPLRPARLRTPDYSHPCVIHWGTWCVSTHLLSLAGITGACGPFPALSTVSAT